MPSTYDTSLPTDKDWVRFFIGDVTVSAALLTDEEINALLADEVNKYMAAARALETLLARWSVAGKGVIAKQVGRLSISKGVGGDGVSAVREAIASLRERGARKSTSAPAMFRAT